MTPRAAAPLLLLALGCGKYGQPVRAGAATEPERKPSFEIPLPAVGDEESAPPPIEPAVPPPETEPPPEGAP